MTHPIMQARTTQGVYQTVTPTVSDRLLQEMPRFFKGNWSTMLRELFQNAYRAGAQNVQLEIDTARRAVTVTDDGCGIRNSQVLLTAGATHWDENRVVEPAGAGFFAMLHDSTLNVMVVSWNHEQNFAWRMQFHPRDVLAERRAIVAGAIVMPDLSPAGTAIRIEVKDDLGALVTKKDDEEISLPILIARALYPFTLALTVDGQAVVTVPPYRRWAPDEIITLDGVGTLEWRCERNLARDGNEVVWDYHTFPALAFSGALNVAGQENSWVGLMHRQGVFRWFIDPPCGVRPKLPDRADLIDDAHLLAAVRALTHAAAEHIQAKTLADIATWPDGMDAADTRTLTTDHAPWLKQYGVADSVLRLAGWHNVRRDEYAGMYFYRDGVDDLSYELTEESRWYRQVATTSSRAVAFTSTQMGQPTVHAPVGGTPGVQRKQSLQVEKLRVHFKCHHVALCSKITVDGIGELPYLLAEEGFDLEQDEVVVHAEGPKHKNHWPETSQPCLLFAGTTAQFSPWFEKNADWAVPFIALSQHHRDSIYDYDWLASDESLKHDEVKRDVLAEVGVLAPRAARQARAEYYAAADVLEQLREMQTRLARIERCSGAARALAFAARQARRMQRQANAVEQRVRALQVRVQGKAELVSNEQANG